MLRTSLRLALMGAVAVLMIAGCSADPTTEAPSRVKVTVTETPSESPSPTEAPSPTKTSAPAATTPGYGDPSTWKLSFNGFGPVKIGMTAEEAVATGGFVEIPFCDVGALEWTGRPGVKWPVLAYLNEAGIVWEINVTDSPAPVDSGLDFGMTYEQVKATYGSRLIHDSAGIGTDGGYAVNGRNTYIGFYIRDGIVDRPSLDIYLAGGIVTPDTMPNSFSCKANSRQ